MDIRIRKLKSTEFSPGMSRSFPTSRTFPTGSKSNCFQQCLNSSTETLASDGCRSPRLGQYRKIPNMTECDVCRAMIKDATSLKCFHSTCNKCLEKYKIVKNGCPVCETDISDSQSNSSNERTPEETLNSVDDLIFHDLDLDIDIDFTEDDVNNLETNLLNELSTKHSRLKKEQLRIISDTEEEVRKIRDHVTKLKAQIDLKAEILLRNAQESKLRHCAELKRQENNIISFTSFVQDSIQSIRDSFSATKEVDGEAKRKSEDSLRNLVKLSEQIVDENVHIRFNIKPVTDNALDSIVGKVGVRVFMGQPLKATLQKTLLFPAAVLSICPISGSQAWIGYQNFIQLCSKSGERSQPIDMNEDVHDLALDEKSNVLIACHASIKVLTPNFHVRTLFTCEQPVQGIACTEEGLIVACVGTSVAMFDREGKLLTEVSDHGIGDIKMPYKARINSNGEICVSDYQSNCGEVGIFDSSGRAVAKIRTDGMAPRGVTYNHQGLIYVSDFRADRINVYSAHGHFLQTLINTGTDGLSGPLSVAVDQSGDLWVGDWKRRLRVYRQGVVPAQQTDSDT